MQGLPLLSMIPRCNKFTAAICKDAGAGRGRDVMAGVKMLEQRGVVGSSRMAVTGWSHGG
jgi:dipeptidyl aminopeptidase/acylaminoacyl peptidase